MTHVPTHPTLLVSALAGLVGLAGCVGFIDDAGAHGGDDEDRVVHPPPSDPGVSLPGPRLRRLTVDQYRNTVRDLLGGDLEDISEIPADYRADERGFTSIGAAEATVGRADTERFEELSLSYAAQVFDDVGRREALVGCDPSDAGDPCVVDFITDFGRRAWRRPLGGDDIDVMVGLVSELAESGEVWDALELTVAALLQSPHFLYRVELGERAAGDSRMIRGYEMASRLSFALLDRGPDDALLDAAAAGELDDGEGVRRHAQRLLEDPRAVAAIQRFFGEYLQLGSLEGIHRDPSVFPDFDPALGDDFRREIDLIVEDAVFDRRLAIGDLLTNRRAFVSPALADHYGVDHPGGDGFEPIDLPADGPRGGLLATAGFLASHAAPEETSPVKRGWFIRLSLLCDDIPEPPPEVQANFPVVDREKTMRQRFEEHTASPTCRACHEALDPLGLPMEEFDAIGMFRVDDRGQELDLSGELDGVPFWGTAEMNDALRDDPRVVPCMTRHVARYFAGVPEFPGEAAVADTVLASGVGADLRSILIEVLASDAFRYAGALEEGE